VSTIREQIIVAALTALNTGLPEGVPDTERERGFALNTNALPSMILIPVRDEASDATNRWGPLQKRRLTLAVDCRAAGSESVYPSVAVDPLAAWVEKALGGQVFLDEGVPLAHRVTVPDTKWAFDSADYSYCLARVLVVVEYQTRVGDAGKRA
jgi:hypothetical protein